MNQGEISPVQAGGLLGFAAATFVGFQLLGIEGCQRSPSPVSPREQQIRELSDRYNVPIEEVRAALNRIDGR
jgi:hypothetical protein